ncbi:MAG TPA: translesion DNA synthesis-associated protein ImuA [Gammaproteobacteria bacterium]|nr:translesion DNA synthesis-associated protein ImuA [Gammaproteobacteria bacterium]
MSLESLLQRADLWRGGEPVRRGPAGVPTGSEALDAELPGGGWPRGALTELLLARPGAGELGLLLPALARLSAEDRWLAWIDPPHLPYAPALASAGIDPARTLLVRPGRTDNSAEMLWAMEQALRAGTCGAVLGWPAAPNHRALRRLQLAAEHGAAVGILFRPLSAADQASPAALRLRLEPAAGGLRLHLLKRRGGWGVRPIFLPTVV